MVCLGNICRSPLAEGILRHKTNILDIDVEIDSAGTSNYHIGEKPDERTCKNAMKHGINISTLRGRQFTKDDFDRFDFIFVMDHSNYANVLVMATNNEQKRKVELVLNVDEPGSNRAVPDPYYGGPDGFEKVFQLLDKACDAIITKHLAI